MKYGDIRSGDIDSVIMKNETATEILRLADDIRGEMLFNYVPNSHYEKTIYYVCGALIRSVVRTKKCDAYKESLILDETSMQVQFEGDTDISLQDISLLRHFATRPFVTRQFATKLIGQF